MARLAPHEKLNRGAAVGLDRATNNHLPALTRAYDRALRAAGRRAAARFRQTETVTAAADPNDPDQTPSWVMPAEAAIVDRQALANDTNQKTRKLHRTILDLSATEALKPFGINYDIDTPTSTAILDAYHKRITDTIGDAIGEQVTNAIRDGYAKGSSVAQVSTAIQAATDEIAPVRADMLARSDLVGLANAGSLLAATTSGASESKTWLTAGDDRVRPDHQDAEGQTVPLDGQFEVGGESCSYPGDPVLSWAQAANCRCVQAYGPAAQSPDALVSSVAPGSDAWRDYAWEGANDPADDTRSSPMSSDEREPSVGQSGSLAAAGSPGVLYLARHGLTEYDSDDHARDTIRGWADDPLNDKGIAEAKRLADNLKPLGITTIQASDLKRAADTATIVGETLGIDPDITDTLRPWNLGDFQGRTSDDARDELVWYVDNPDEPVPGGEAFSTFASRFLPVVADAMTAAENGEAPLLVTHSHNLKLARAWIRGGRAPVTGEAFMEPSPGPAAVLKCDPADGWQVTEILCDGQPLPDIGHVPDWAHYRPGEPGHECDMCEFFALPSRCTMFHATVIPDYVCDEFQPTADSAAITSGGTMRPEDILTAAAVGDTGLPLSERDRPWDAGAAGGRVKKWASSDGSGDPDKIDYKKLARAYFWQMPADGSVKIGDFKLPFADIVGGKLTAVFRGVTAGAARLSQTDGVDKGAVQKKMGAYYRKAASQYGDKSIKPPWASGNASTDGETLAAHHAYLADHGADVLDDDDIRAYALLHQRFTDSATVTASALAEEEWALMAAAAGGTQWTAILCVAGQPTVDGGIKRVLDTQSGSWLPLPRPLALLDDSPHADVTTRSPICGRIDQIWWAGNVCQASGVFFDDSDDPHLQMAGSKAAALVAELRGQLGVSVDLLPDFDYELMVWNGSSLAPIEEMDSAEMDVANDPTARNYDGPSDPNAPNGPASEANLPTDIPDMEVEEDSDESELVACLSNWTIAGATICPVQALTQATISIVASGQGFVAMGALTEGGFRWHTPAAFLEPTLTASAAGLAPTEPPRDWFFVDEADEPTPLTVTDDGQVFGHIGLWNSCHTAFQDRCVPPPKSPSDYAGFHLGEISDADGNRVEVGTLTMDTNHAPKQMGALAARAHYDHTGTAAAYVRASDGKHGIWVCGSLSARLDAADAQALMAAKPSGDWRNIFGKGRDMLGALMVNYPGFVVPRTLTASGMPGGDVTVELSCTPCAESMERELAVLAASAEDSPLEALAALAEA